MTLGSPKLAHMTLSLILAFSRNTFYVSLFASYEQIQGRTQGGGFGGSKLPISLSTKMHNKENITFLALLSLFICNDTDSNMI